MKTISLQKLKKKIQSKDDFMLVHVLSKEAQRGLK